MPPIMGIADDKTICDALAQAGLEILEGPDGLLLTDGTLRLQADFEDMVPRLAPGKLSRELLVRAAKVKDVLGTPRAIDATAGMGEDSLLLAAAGFEVTMFESNSVIAALVADACAKAVRDPRLSDAASRMSVERCDSARALRELSWAPDVIYLDPMFPTRRKSAAVKKKFQLIHHLEQHSGDEEELLAAAMDAHPRKLVVKRPLKGPFLGDVKPSYSLRGKAVRYDVLVGV